MQVRVRGSGSVWGCEGESKDKGIWFKADRE